MGNTPQFLKRNDAPNLAYHAQIPSSCDAVVMFLTGFRSDMNGTKAVYLEQACQEKNIGFVRFDYSGHGESSGDFDEGTISSWLQDTLDVIDQIVRPKISSFALGEKAPKIYLVGSSMGGWIGLLASLARPDVVGGFVGIAAAPDFAHDVLREFSDDQTALLHRQGYVDIPTPYSDIPHRFTKLLLDDGVQRALLRGEGGIPLDIPVTLIQGMDDQDVPWQKAVQIAKHISPSQARLVLVEQADHRVSREDDLKLIWNEVQRMITLPIASDNDKDRPSESVLDEVRCFIRLA